MKIFHRFSLSDFLLRFGESNVNIHPYYITFYGPFSISSHYDKNISVNRYKKILIICKKENLDSCKSLSNDLKNGLEGNNWRVYKGFNNIFRTNIDFQVVDYDSGNDYDPNKILSVYEDNYESKTFPLIVLPKTARSEIDSIYYRVKANFLNPELGELSSPTQIVTTDTLKNSSIYIWSLLPMAIQLFVKMGGVPYSLAQSPVTKERTLSGKISLHIIGLGLSRDPLNNKNYVGYVSVFDSYGVWVFGDSNVLDSNNVPTSFGEIISRYIKDIASKSSVQDHIVIIHYSGKELGRDDDEKIRKAIQEAKNSLGSRVIIFVLKINYSDLVLIDDSSEYQGKSGENSWYPPIGLTIKLKNNVYALSTTGTFKISNQQTKANIFRGLPTLLLVSRHIELENESNLDESNLDDLTLIRTVFAMARLNYVSVQNPMLKEPITTRYSREIAYLTSRVFRVSEKTLPENVKKVMWFI
ncbi:hypothetical protein SJAV_12270 [Sulfurisphaera javensis]|uniref:Piwi domain-containing protein n=1 Tax=Sulfurisphaera javensis TaxID=2049879 RepID=A0AAT9GR26_9CREN